MKSENSIVAFFRALFCTAIFSLVLFVLSVSLYAGEPASKGRETIYYDISPLGVSVYEDRGLVDFFSRKLNLAVFNTQVLGFKDTEKIYSDPRTGLPVFVERDVAAWFDKEYLTEDYDQENNKLVIKKFKEGKKVEENQFQALGPIQNAVILPFSLRNVADLKIGWSCLIRLPEEFKIQLLSIEDVVVPAGKYKAYRFVSIPEKFQIWISADDLRLPVKIVGMGGLPYALAMKKHIIGQEKAKGQ